MLVGRSQETTVAVWHFDDVVVELPADSDTVVVRDDGRKAWPNTVSFRWRPEDQDMSDAVQVQNG